MWAPTGPWAEDGLASLITGTCGGGAGVAVLVGSDVAAAFASAWAVRACSGVWGNSEAGTAPAASASSSKEEASSASVAAIRRRCPCRVHRLPYRSNVMRPEPPARPLMTPMSVTHLIVIVSAGRYQLSDMSHVSMHNTLAGGRLSQQQLPSNILTGQAPGVKVTSTMYSPFTNNDFFCVFGLWRTQ